MNIVYVTGDATCPTGSGKKMIVHVCNNRGGWGAGFVVALSRRWKEPERSYRLLADLHRPEHIPMGQVDFATTDDDEIEVANMVAQEGFWDGASQIPLRYWALKECLEKVAEYARPRGFSIHMPRIGCGLAGGSWEDVEPILYDKLQGLEVTVYDLPT